MSTQLIERLKQACEADPSLQPLTAQWAFDQQLIGKALQNVAVQFPHYSRHDESHSVQILTNIERVLGSERIEQLSGTDVWLMLEAAYLHDVGMVVSQQQKQQDWSSEEFRNFVQQESARNGDAGSDAILAALQGGNLFQIGTNPALLITKIGYTLAEFYRRKHPKRASEIARTPKDTIGLDSPRNELIPSRLFALLGDICAMHGRDQASVLELPHVAAGLGRDTIHPRYIACMLRLGDLLDLDDNRFCPIMLSVAGELPPKTHAHIDKHRGVRHLRIDPRRIEVHSVCTTYEGYIESENWFEYLRSEVAWQMAHWADIVPNERLGLLPTIGRVITELTGYELIDNRSRPNFDFSRDRVFELLQGAGVYESERDALRELVQNAVDATLILAWLKYGEGERDGLAPEETIYRYDNPYGTKVQTLLGRLPIRIDVLQNDDAATAKTHPVTVRITDSGIGIGREDLATMTRVGASYRETWKRGVYERMPTWMRPSGAFGIGLQSLFLVTDEISFQSRSLISRDSLQLRMTNPVGDERGSIYIKKAPGTHTYSESGTRVQLNLKKNFIDSFQARRSPFEHFDPIIPREVDYFSEVLSHLPVPVLINGEIRGDSKLTSLQWHYIDEHSAAVALDLDEDSRSGARLFFKGQEVGLFGERLELPCRVYVDVFGDAEELLAVNRRSFRNTKVLERVQTAIAAAAAQALGQTSRDDHRTLLSTLLLALEKPTTDEYLEVRWLEPSDTSNYARRYRYVKNADDATFPTIGELLKGDAKLYHAFGDYAPQYLQVKGRHISSVDNSLSIFIKAIIHQGYRGYIDTVTRKGVTIGWDNTSEAWDTDALRKLLLESIIPGLRLALPVTKAFAPLASFKWTPWVGELSRSPFCPNRKYMYSPFIVEHGKVTTSKLDELVVWTFVHRENPVVTIEEIRRCYHDFILLVDQAMRDEPSWANVIGYNV
ncbi:hypothetical protein KDH83_03430 [Achromobacter sp. Marseille-Q0513]|uniref:HD domain-containing protein n=1 Tax=Achromobacter sp. Marseille-Q0513 TaxID=2829161 RepID=UPI001B8FE121|nr:hypothetical protein [Achromobacter sp. Marseille-Q0513]MBR8652357.1 hypothetical protein [Achromobacter sp. Marseille-Q0513]